MLHNILMLTVSGSIDCDSMPASLYVDTYGTAAELEDSWQVTFGASSLQSSTIKPPNRIGVLVSFFFKPFNSINKIKQGGIIKWPCRITLLLSIILSRLKSCTPSIPIEISRFKKLIDSLNRFWAVIAPRRQVFIPRLYSIIQKRPRCMIFLKRTSDVPKI